MSLSSGTRLGIFEITGLLGKGGMGEVYRATDTKLGREVAIKVLSSDFAADPERLARFEREAKTLASLNHDNIGSLYDFQQDGEIRFLVLELIEGETLADRIDRSAVPVKEVLPLFIQIAVALEEAHEHGIVHRDLKPANIKITPEGKIKVLDFGIAKTYGPQRPVSPTETTRASDPNKVTTDGTLLGTPSYMSPEQARGQEVDKRADIWAFGCCLYESLTGSPPFRGDTLVDTFNAILEHDPDWTQLPDDTPEDLRKLLRRCLEKDARRRLRDAGDIAITLDHSRDAPPIEFTSISVDSAPFWRRQSPWLVGAVALVIGVASTVLILGTLEPSPGSIEARDDLASRAAAQTPAEVPKPVRRFLIDREDSMPPVTDIPDTVNFETLVALSPDGSQIVYVGDVGGPASLVLRSLDRVGTRVLPNTNYARVPFFSPDGKWVGYFRFREGLDCTLMKIEIETGRTVEICEAGDFPLGGAWGKDGTIVFASRAGGGLMRVPQSGGTPEIITTPDRAAGEEDHELPHILPDGGGILFTIFDGTDYSIGRTSKDGGEHSVLIESAGAPLYSPLGYLTYIHDGRWLAASYDPAQPDRIGAPHDITEALMRMGDFSIAVIGVANFSPLGIALSNEGAMVFVRSSAIGDPIVRLAWVDLEGNVEALDFEPGDYWNARISPDGKRIATDLAGSDLKQGVWVLDLERSTRRPLATKGINGQANWMPNGLSLVYYTRYDLDGDIILGPAMRDVDYRSEYELIALDGPGQYYPHSVSPDGKWLAVAYRHGMTAPVNVGIISLEGEEPLRPISDTDFWEDFPTISPDGKWISYSSNESGQMEVYVVPFSGQGGNTLVSTNGGHKSVWAPDGKTLYYQKGKAMMAVAIEAEPEFAAGIPRTLFEGDFYSQRGRDYDLSPEGDRFLMLIRSEKGDGQVSSRSLVFVDNWSEVLKELAALDGR